MTASGQIAAEDIPAIKAEGFTTVITVRPDGEVPGQPTAQEIGAAASEAGLRHQHLPLVGGTIPEIETVKAFADAMETGPVFAYCGSGPRVVLMASLAAAASGRPVDEIIAEASEAGFNLSQARPLLEEMADAAR